MAESQGIEHLAEITAVRLCPLDPPRSSASLAPCPLESQSHTEPSCAASLLGQRTRAAPADRPCPRAQLAAEKMLQEDRLLGLLLRRAAEELRPQWEADLREVEERSAAETTHLLRQTEALQEQAALQEAQVRVLAPGAPPRARVTAGTAAMHG